MRSFTTVSAAVALLSGTTNAFFRMECFSRIALARLDPLVSPGKISNHAHVIHGGVNFGMDTTYDDLRASNCTSCRVVDDKSAYWTPALMFQHENGTFEIVRQVGGMLVYYNPVRNEGEKVEAYPPGFRMIAGDNKLRSFYTDINSVPEKSLYREEDLKQPALAQKALGFNCLNYKGTPEAAFLRHEMPEKSFMDQNCADGIRAEIAFPSCWNGEKDSDNHKDHVAYPSAVETGGTCPEGYDRRLPTMLFETKWDTYAFKDVPGEFTFANGDPTGFGYHGDYMMGWDETILQNALDMCDNQSGRIEDCPVFSSQTELQTETKCTECKMEMPEVLANENCAGPMDALCGGVEVSREKGGPNSDDGVVEGAPAAGAGPSSTSAEAPPAPTSTAAAEVPSVPEVPTTAPETKPTDALAGPVDGQAPGNSEIAVEGAPAPTPEPVVPSSVAALPAAPAPTQAPAPPPQEAPVTGPTTLYRTLSDRIEEVVYVEQTETVYVTAPAPQKYRRHAHAHHLMKHRRDREHGLLGNKY
ncbi:hypothetical protein K458DRAFT_20051 [Lentithecium fluviatile CBS 122367]|uniref:DUF1996 domain-containing protein n=1 Tax=Lentithecium fluviatile CBS 122367 TaxID=1168545 RepID=A0A6G1J4M2_9PLEO|nr:hypothetical protein K458DRAFT_20051 [Lentithecium fluviatile CBS 122367]